MPTLLRKFPMNADTITNRLAEIDGTTEPSLRTLRVAALLRELFLEHDCQIVVVGGSAIELLTEGLYTSGDLDICFDRTRPAMRVIAEVMGSIGASGGVRSFRVNDLFIDVLGMVETLAKTPFRKIGGVLVAKPEDLMPERVLMAVYPQSNAQARSCAEKIFAVALAGELQVDWDEAERVAALPEYDVLDEFRATRETVASRAREGEKP